MGKKKMMLSGYFLLALMVAVSSGADKPNIVFMLADDLGWNDVGYNNPDIISPTIDALAASGVKLTQSYVQPLCSPSRTALMTSAYPFTQGLSHLAIQPEQPVCVSFKKKFLPQVLQDNGYATHMIGKWHLGFCNWNCTPTYRGFDSFLGYYADQEDFYTRITDNYYDFRFNEAVSTDANDTYSTEVFTARAKTVIEEHDKNKPLFLYMPFQSVHTPLQVPQKYEDMYPEVTNPQRKSYSGMMTAMDDAIAEVVQHLKDHDLYNNTLIIFSSDNGGHPVGGGGSNLPLRGAKTSVFEGGTRAPGFVHSPLLPNPGKSYDGMMHIVDWFPTLMEAAGIQYDDPERDGVSQWTALTTLGPSPRTEFVYNIDLETMPLSGQSAIRVGDYKLIDGFAGLYQDWYPTSTQAVDIGTTINTQALLTQTLMNSNYEDQHFLYNVKDDPEEKNNLFKSKPLIVAQLSAKLDHYKKRWVPAKFPPNDPRADPANFGGVWSPGWC